MQARTTARKRVWQVSLVVAIVAAVALPSAAAARSDSSWRGILAEGKGLWWDELSYGCNLYSFQQMGGTDVMDGRLARWFHTRNPFTGQCQRRVAPVQQTTAFWSVRGGVLTNGFVGLISVRYESVRLMSYSRATNILTVARDGALVRWYGCHSRYNPYPC